MYHTQVLNKLVSLNQIAVSKLNILSDNIILYFLLIVSKVNVLCRNPYFLQIRNV